MRETTQDIHKKIHKLPSEKQVEVENFIEFLLSRESGGGHKGKSGEVP